MVGRLQIITTGDNDTSPPPTHYVLARPYEKGRVLALGHEAIVTADALKIPDNSHFVTNAVHWLDTTNTKRVLFTTGHDEEITEAKMDGLRTLLPNYSFDPVTTPITGSQLPRNTVLIIGHAKADFTAAEIEAICQFVADGGGLLLAAQGWAWTPYFHRPLDEFPMNRVGEPFKVRWLGANLRDTTSETADEEVLYHVFYHDQRTMAPIGLINNDVDFTASNARLTTSPQGCPAGFVAKYLFDALLILTNGSPPRSSLDVRVLALTYGNLLRNAFGAPGGSEATLSVPFQAGYSDGILAQGGESVTVPFEICLKALQPFNFFVDVLGRSENDPQSPE